MTVPLAFAGEGNNELGSRALERPYQTDDRDGVLQALTRKIQPDGWHVRRGIRWASLTKYDPRRRVPAEVDNVRRAALDAEESGCAALIFSRDTDGDEDRARDIAEGVRLARESFPVMGGVANPKLEAWILALQGQYGSEDGAILRSDSPRWARPRWLRLSRARTLMPSRPTPSPCARGSTRCRSSASL